MEGIRLDGYILWGIYILQVEFKGLIILYVPFAF